MTTRCVLAMLACTVAVPALAQDDLVLPEITLQAESGLTLTQNGYVAKTSRQATRLDTPVAEIPQAITIITQDQIEDQAPRTLNEALTYSAAANPNKYGFDTRFDAFTLRGFPAFYNGMFRDGLRQYNAPFAIHRPEPYGLEGIAILKGPASSLYGVSGAGGLVNLVTKRPKDKPFHELAVETGSDDRAQISADFSGPLASGSPFSYRLTGRLRKANSVFPGYADDLGFFAPALRYDNGTTRVTLLGEAQKNVTGGSTFYLNGPNGTVTDTFLTDPDWNRLEREQFRLGYEVEHDLNDSVTLRHTARISSVDVEARYGGALGQPWERFGEKLNTTSIDTGISAFATTGAVQHEILAGIDLTMADYTSRVGGSPVSAAAAAAGPMVFFRSQDTRQTGIYLHDQLSWGNWRAFVSGRYDRVKTDDTDMARTLTRIDESGRSGRVGLSYRWDNGLVAYGNVSTSFAPNLGVVYDVVADDSSARAARPTQATQREVGLKYAPEGTDMLLSAALFDIDQRDGVVFEAYGGTNRQRQQDMNSRGIELEAMANWDNGWSTIASFSHQRVVIERGATGTEGNRVSGAPDNILSLWGKYEFQSGRAEGLAVGLGLRYVGESYGDDANTDALRNDARSFVDAEISFDPPAMPGVRAQVNIKNLFDQDGTICDVGYCYRNEGRVWTASLTRRF
ncbi:TonB-dependent siderophore receptor [Paracoccus jiaweipingae]|uniref:TonB-dependent siderophore receptor n=1 Tax=unclassified Paracoccus (in: a-proteobacteria) TaxID=2688777 RepID=UPI0037BC0271